jgi:glycosyltransferase involved in cell wall biosynthesis
MQVRILHVVGDSKFGGASTGILRLAKFWRSVDWDVEVLTTDTELLGAARREGVGVLPLDVIWRDIRPWRDLMGLWRLYRHLRANPYTLVHTHTTKAGFIGRLAAWMAGVPIVLHTAHGFAFHESSSKLKILFYTALERIASVGCRKVVTVSRFHESWGRKLGIAAPNKILAISNGIPDASRYREVELHEIRQSWGVEPGQFAIFTPGRLAPEKGLEDLVEAIALLDPEIRGRTRVIIAGEGVLGPSLERLVQDKQLGPVFRFLGFQHEVRKLMAASDLVVLPTWREGLSIALLEAMAQGCAILTTSIGSNKEATDNGAAAFLAAPRRPEDLAILIRQAFHNPSLRAGLGCRAREIFEERYTQEKMLTCYHQLYLTLLKEFDSAHPVSPILSSTHR